MSQPLPEGTPEAIPDAVAILANSPKPRTVSDAVAFFLSAVLSPYIVLPVGTIGIIWARGTDERVWLWIGISLFFSTVLPVLFVLNGMRLGTITDVHVAERDQRSGPFGVAIGGSVVAALVLFLIHAPRSVWGLSVILAVNGLAIMLATRSTKISVHVAVLTATVLGATILNPELPVWAFIWLIPLLMWARLKRGRHSIWQGVGGFALAAILTFAVIVALGLTDRLKSRFQPRPQRLQNVQLRPARQIRLAQFPNRAVVNFNVAGLKTRD